MMLVAEKPRRTYVRAAAAILAVCLADGRQAVAGETPPPVSVTALDQTTPGAANGAMTQGGTTSPHMMSSESVAAVPAGVIGAHMAPAGAFMLTYTPMLMGMSQNYIGSSQVSQQFIATTIPFVPTGAATMKPPTLRIVPQSMTTEMHMFHAMFGLTDSISLMVMGDYIHKNMTMTTFSGMKGSTILGNSSASTEGWGDTTFSSLVRLYQDEVHHIHLNLGVSIPSGSITEQTTMLSPMGGWMTMRGNYAMQLGTGTYDGLYGFTYLGRFERWSWGFAYRGRAAFGNNDQGYHWGPSNDLTGWAAYEVLPGLSLTGRAAGSIWDRIHGADYWIAGPMQASNPYDYGGQRVEMFGGFEYKTRALGTTPVRLAVEAGAPIYQNLNGPQMGKAWQVNIALGVAF